LTVSWATHRVGGTSAPISPAYGAEDVRNQLAAVGAKAVFTCITLLSVTLDAAAAVGIPPSHVYLLEIPRQVSAGISIPHHIKTVDHLIHNGKSRDIIETVQWSGGRGAEQVAYLCASSGTSGFPVSGFPYISPCFSTKVSPVVIRQKTVKISHKNVIANAMQYKTYESQWHKNEPEFCLGLLPQSHSFGLIIVCHGNIYRGDGVVVMPRFDVQEMLEAIDRFRLARLYLVREFFLLPIVCIAQSISSICGMIQNWRRRLTIH
jgi:long-subunit acyl-CoA synthetase (AMP-forming)